MFAASSSVANVSFAIGLTCTAYDAAALPAEVTFAVTTESAAARYEKPNSMSNAEADALGASGNCAIGERGDSRLV